MEASDRLYFDQVNSDIFAPLGPTKEWFMEAHDKYIGPGTVRHQKAQLF
jgi:hypothetical protein